MFFRSPPDMSSSPIDVPPCVGQRSPPTSAAPTNLPLFPGFSGPPPNAPPTTLASGPLPRLYHNYSVITTTIPRFTGPTAPGAHTLRTMPGPSTTAYPVYFGGASQRFTVPHRPRVPLPGLPGDSTRAYPGYTGGPPLSFIGPYTPRVPPSGLPGTLTTAHLYLYLHLYPRPPPRFIEPPPPGVPAPEIMRGPPPGMMPPVAMPQPHYAAAVPQVRYQWFCYVCCPASLKH